MQELEARRQFLRSGYAVLVQRRAALAQELQRVERELVMLEGALIEFDRLLQETTVAEESK